MSFETIRIQRRQPIIDKRYVKIPGKENYETPPVEYSTAVNNIDNIDVTSIGMKDRDGIIPFYQKDMNLDFITYAEVGLDGRVIGSGAVVDFQQELRDVSESLILYDALVESIVSQWVENVISNGGDIGSVSVPALKSLVQSLVDLGVWDNFDHIWPLAGEDLPAALVPLKGNSLVNINFVSDDYARTSGLTGGSGKYLDTQYRPSELTKGIYADTLTFTAADAIPIGCRSSDFSQPYRIITQTSQILGDIKARVTSPDPAPGFIAITVFETSAYIYLDGILKDSNTKGSQLDPGHDIYLMAGNNGGSAGSYYTVIAAYRTALGRV
jgi:hypothetical protein